MRISEILNESYNLPRGAKKGNLPDGKELYNTDNGHTLNIQGNMELFFMPDGSFAGMLYHMSDGRRGPYAEFRPVGHVQMRDIGSDPGDEGGYLPNDKDEVSYKTEGREVNAIVTKMKDNKYQVHHIVWEYPYHVTTIFVTLPNRSVKPRTTPGKAYWKNSNWDESSGKNK